MKFQDAYRGILSRVEPSTELVERTAALAGDAAPARIRRPFYRRPLALAAAILLCLLLSVSVLGAAVPAFNDFLGLFAPGFAGFLQSIGTERESGGMKLTVVSAINDGETAAVYFTLQDLQGGRLGPESKIREGFLTADSGLERTASSDIHLLEFDSATNTASFCALVTQAGLAHSTLKLELSGLYQREERWLDRPLALDLNRLPAQAGMEYRIGTGREEAYFGAAARGDTLRMLAPSAEGNPLCPETPELLLSGAAFLGGRLHVQVFSRTPPDGEDPAWGVSLQPVQEGGGPILQSEAYLPEILSYYDPETDGYLLEYSWLLPEEWEQMELTASIVRRSGLTKGVWESETFTPKQPEWESCSLPPIDLAGYSLDEVTLTMLGLSLAHRPEEGLTDGYYFSHREFLEMTVELVCGDRSIPCIRVNRMQDSDGCDRVKFLAVQPVNPAEVTALRINGQAFSIS